MVRFDSRDSAGYQAIVGMLKVMIQDIETKTKAKAKAKAESEESADGANESAKRKGKQRA